MKGVFFEATKRSLGRNRLRTAATLIGAVISVAMITGVLCMSSSFHSFLVKTVKESYGNWSVSVRNIDDEMAKEAEKAGIDFGVTQAVGYSYINSANPQKPFLFLENMDEAMGEIGNTRITEGRLPKNSEEIVLPEHLTANAGISYEIGDKITLEIGERIDIHEGGDLDQWDAYEPKSEAFISRDTRTFTVVGICERPAVEPYMAAGYTAITCDNKPVMRCTFTYFSDEDYGNIMPLLREYYGEDSDDVTYNEELLNVTGEKFDIRSTGIPVVMTLILLAVIILGSYMLMYNTFSISVMEKRRQYEIFASVGATRSQLKRITLYEGIFYGAVSIPLGIILGMAGAFLLTVLAGNQMAGIISSDINGSVDFDINFGTIFLAFIISLRAVYIAISVPAAKAGMTKPIEEREREKQEGKKERAERKRLTALLLKTGGPEMVLAERNFRRHHRHYRYTIVSVVMSVVLFVTAGAVVIYMQNGITARLGTSSGFDISYEGEQREDAEAAYMILSNTDGVTESTYLMKGTMDVYLGRSPVQYAFYMIDDNAFASYLHKSGIDPSGYFDGASPKAIATSTINRYDRIAGSIREKTIFNESERPSVLKGFLGGRQTTVEIGMYVDEIPDGLIDSVGVPVVLMSKSAGQYILNNSAENAFTGKALFRSDDPAQTYAAMRSLCRDNGLAEDGLMNIQEARDEAGSVLALINLVSFGFIILISIIAMANLFNTVASNIEIRKAEFATLSSSGMTPGSIRKMIYLESLMLGIRMLLYTIPLSFIGLMFAYNFTNYGSSITGYVTPWSSVFISAVLMGLIIAVIMKYSCYKVEKIDAATVLKSQKFYK